MIVSSLMGSPTPSPVDTTCINNSTPTQPKTNNSILCKQTRSSLQHLEGGVSEPTGTNKT